MTQKTSAPSYASVTGVAARPWARLARLKAGARAAAEAEDEDGDEDGDNGKGEATYRGGTCQY